jgi:hypothetical protein
VRAGLTGLGLFRGRGGFGSGGRAIFARGRTFLRIYLWVRVSYFTASKISGENNIRGFWLYLNCYDGVSKRPAVKEAQVSPIYAN